MENLHWHELSRFGSVQHAIEATRPFGVVLHSCLSTPVTYWWSVTANRVMCQVGEMAVYKSGRVRVWPYEQVTERQLVALLGSAEDAVRNRPSKQRGWTLYRSKKVGSYWCSRVSLPADDNEAAAQAVMAARDQALSASEIRNLVSKRATAGQVSGLVSEDQYQ